jgi:hypothetical protein
VVPIREDPNLEPVSNSRTQTELLAVSAQLKPIASAKPSAPLSSFNKGIIKNIQSSSTESFHTSEGTYKAFTASSMNVTNSAIQFIQKPSAKTSIVKRQNIRAITPAISHHTGAIPKPSAFNPLLITTSDTIISGKSNQFPQDFVYQTNGILPGSGPPQVQIL